MIQRPLKCLVSEAKYESNFYVYCYIIGWHGNSMHNNVSIYLHKKFQLRGTFKGWTMFFDTKYLNDNSEFDSKITYIMFLHNYDLACKISTIRYFFD